MSQQYEDMIADLKQFIAVTVVQAIAPVAQDVSELKQDVAVLKDDVTVLKQDVAALKNGLDEINLRLDTIADAQAEQLDNHDRRIVRLERKPA